MRSISLALLGLAVTAGFAAAAPPVLLTEAWNDVGIVQEIGEFDGQHGLDLMLIGTSGGRFELRNPFSGSIEYKFPIGYYYPAGTFLSFAGDLDGDPSDELVLYTSSPIDPSMNRLGLFDVDGTFGPRWEATNVEAATGIQVADFEGTGVKFIVLSSGVNDFEIRRFTTGEVVYSWASNGSPSEHIENLQPVDFDQDGQDELLITTLPMSGGRRTHVLYLTSAVGVGDQPPTFEDVTLAARNVPNPFQGPTRIDFTLPTRERVAVRVFDPAGRLVRTLVDGTRAAGPQTITWDGRDDHGHGITSGVYFYEVRAGGERIARKMLRLR